MLHQFQEAWHRIEALVIESDSETTSPLGTDFREDIKDARSRRRPWRPSSVATPFGSARLDDDATVNIEVSVWRSVAEPSLDTHQGTRPIARTKSDSKLVVRTRTTGHPLAGNRPVHPAALRLNPRCMERGLGSHRGLGPCYQQQGGYCRPRFRSALLLVICLRKRAVPHTGWWFRGSVPRHPHNLVFRGLAGCSRPRHQRVPRQASE